MKFSCQLLKRLSLFILSLLITFSLQAHPSYGLVINEAGELIFCDVLNNEGTIWKWSEQNGLEKLLTGEHCHFIFQDQQGNIWGTNHEYIERTESNLNTLWKYTPPGNKEIIIHRTVNPDFSGNNFTVDSKGMIYFNWDNQLFVRKAEGSPTLFVPDTFDRIVSLQMDAHDNLFVVENNLHQGSIFRISPQKEVKRIADHLKEIPPPNPPFREARFNMLYAAFIAPNGHTFVANSGSRRITEILPDGSKKHIFHSVTPYYPVAYCERNGKAYVMEMGFKAGKGNLESRIWQINDGKIRLLVDVEKPEIKRGAFNLPVSGERRKMLPFTEIFLGILLGLGGLYYWRKRSNK